MKIFVIGGTGYLGRRILYEIAFDEGLSITALGRGEVPADLRLKNVAWIAGDTGEPERYASHLEGCDLVLNMGGINSPAVRAGRALLIEENVTKLERLLKEVRRRQVKLFVHVTDVCALGNTGNVTGDEERVNKGNFSGPYEESKWLGLQLVENLRPDVNTIAALLGPTFGHDDPGYVWPILRRAATGKLGTLIGGQHYLSPIWIEDVKKGLLQLLVKAEENKRYILAGEPIELQNLVYMVASLARCRPNGRSCDGLWGRLAGSVAGAFGVEPWSGDLARYLTGANYAFESHRTKRDLRWSHGLLRDRLADLLKESGLIP